MVHSTTSCSQLPDPHSISWGSGNVTSVHARHYCLRNPLISRQLEDVLSENESEVRKKKHHMCDLTSAASGLNHSSHCTTEHTGSSPSGVGNQPFWVWVTEVLYFAVLFPPSFSEKTSVGYMNILYNYLPICSAVLMNRCEKMESWMVSSSVPMCFKPSRPTCVQQWWHVVIQGQRLKVKGQPEFWCLHTE